MDTELSGNLYLALTLHYQCNDLTPLHLGQQSIYLSASDLLSFIISNTDKHEFSSKWKWICLCNSYE